MPNILETTDAEAGTSTSYTLVAGQSAQGFLSVPGDHDWYRIDLVAGQTYTFGMTATGDAASDVHGACSGWTAFGRYFPRGRCSRGCLRSHHVRQWKRRALLRQRWCRGRAAVCFANVSGGLAMTSSDFQVA
jgi:hypothetical protein